MSVFRLVLLLAALGPLTASAGAQESEQDTTFDLGAILGDGNSGGLSLSSGKTYNRVEGLPIQFGPTYRGPLGPGEISMSALGILRSAHNFAWDSDNIGHRLSASFRVGRRRGFAAGAEAYDVVSKIEPWQLTEPDGGLAAFFLKRDYFDFFGRILDPFVDKIIICGAFIFLQGKMSAGLSSGVTGWMTFVIVAGRSNASAS